MENTTPPKPPVTSALEHELELAAVAEAQVAQAEGLIQVADAIRAFQKAFSKLTITATFIGVATGIICLYLHLHTYNQFENLREAADLSIPWFERQTNAIPIRSGNPKD